MINVKHILFITPGFPGKESETDVLTYFLHYVRELKALHSEIEVSIITLHYPFKKANYKWHNCEVYSLNGQNSSLPKSFFLWKKALKIALEINQKKPFTIINSLWIKECCYLGNKLKSKLNVPHICTALGTEVKRNNRYKGLLPLKKMDLVFLSEFQKAVFNENYSSKSQHVISYGIQSLKNSINLNTQRTFDLIGVGWFSNLKNYDSFINVVDVLRKKKPKIKSILIGGGVNEAALKQKVKQLKLQENVIILSQINNEEVQQYMLQSKILLHPSTFESQGFVFLEALQMGLAIVSRNVGTAKTSERWKTADNVEEMASAVETLLHSSFPLPKVEPIKANDTVNLYLNLYQSLINEHQSKN